MADRHQQAVLGMGGVPDWSAGDIFASLTGGPRNPGCSVISVIRTWLHGSSLLQTQQTGLFHCGRKTRGRRQPESSHRAGVEPTLPPVSTPF